MANFEAFRWNFSSSTNPEIGRSEYVHEAFAQHLLDYGHVPNDGYDACDDNSAIFSYDFDVLELKYLTNLYLN